MTTKTTGQLRSDLDRADARAVLVRGATAPPRPPATVTVAPSVVAKVTPRRRHASLYVTAETRCGRTIRRYDGRDYDAAADAAAALVADVDPHSVWLCDRERIQSWWGDDAVELLERRLATVARQVDAQLVGWTTAEDGAVGDRYDVTFDS